MSVTSWEVPLRRLHSTSGCTCVWKAAMPNVRESVRSSRAASSAARTASAHKELEGASGTNPRADPGEPRTAQGP
eukprot:2877377-Pyramimonas_sp.AAC.1